MMKLYKDNAKAKSYFYYYGWTILAFLEVFFLVFFLIFQAIFHVKRYEKIDLFVAAYGLKDYDFEKKVVSNFKDKGLVEFNIYSYMEDDANTANYFSANGEKADFVIFSESNILDMKEYIEYNYIDVSTLEDDIPSLSKYETYLDNSVSRGIKLFDGTNSPYNESHTFNNLFEFTKDGKESESYYLLIDNETENFDKENNHVLGYEVLEYLLSQFAK